MITVSQHEVVKESFPQVFQGIIRGWEHDTLKLLKRGTGDEREASDLVQGFSFTNRKNCGDEVGEAKVGDDGNVCRARAGRDGKWWRSWSGAFSPFPNTPFAPTFDN